MVCQGSTWRLVSDMVCQRRSCTGGLRNLFRICVFTSRLDIWAPHNLSQMRPQAGMHHFTHLWELFQVCALARDYWFWESCQFVPAACLPAASHPAQASPALFSLTASPAQPRPLLPACLPVNLHFLQLWSERSSWCTKYNKSEFKSDMIILLHLGTKFIH